MIHSMTIAFETYVELFAFLRKLETYTQFHWFMGTHEPTGNVDILRAIHKKFKKGHAVEIFFDNDDFTMLQSIARKDVPRNITLNHRFFERSRKT